MIVRVEMGLRAAARPERGGRPFADVRSAWQALGSNAQNVFQTPEWVEGFADRVDDDVAWGMLDVAGRPAAVSVLRRSVHREAGNTWNVLSELRVGESQVLHGEGLLDRRLIRGPRLRELLDASGPWDVLRLTGLRSVSPWLELADCAQVQVEADGGVGVLDTSGGIDECWGAIHKNMRHSIRKARRRVSASGDASVVVATGSDVAGAYEAFIALEASGWKGRGAGALVKMAQERELLRDYLRVSGTAQIRSLHIDGRLVASQVAVTVARTLFLWRIAYDQRFSALSPSNVLMADLVQTCCADPGIDRIDCLVWQPWHARWGMAREPTYSLLDFNPRSVPNETPKHLGRLTLFEPGRL